MFVCMYVCPGLTSWNWTILYGIISPLEAAESGSIEATNSLDPHLGVGPCGIPSLCLPWYVNWCHDAGFIQSVILLRVHWRIFPVICRGHDLSAGILGLLSLRIFLSSISWCSLSVEYRACFVDGPLFLTQQSLSLQVLARCGSLSQSSAVSKRSFFEGESSVHLEV